MRPRVENLGKRIALLERRCEHLENREAGSPRARDYDLAEVIALRTVIEIATWYALDGRRAASESEHVTPVGLCFELLELDPGNARAVRALQDKVAEFLEGMD